MLQTIRDRAQGWLAWIIVGLLIIPFALWGIQEYLGNDVEISVARVDGTDISQREFQNAYEQQRERVRAMLGADAKSLDEAKIKQAVLDGLIRNEVLRQATDTLALRVGNEQLAREIQSIPDFQKDGQFSKQQFTELLRRQGLNAERFEALVRASLLSDQLNAAVTGTAITTRHELDEAIRLKNQQREIGYFIVPWQNFKQDVKVDDAAITRHYEQNRERFVTPEQASIEYLELSAQDLAKGIQPDEQALRKLYEELRANFSVGEQRRVSHILFTLPPNADDKTITAAKDKAEGALKRLRAGEPFAKLAKEYSQDTATAQKGGDLGFVEPGMLDPMVESALSAVKPGEPGELVQGTSGFHIVKVTEVKPARVKTFDEVRAELEAEYRQRTAQQQFFEKAEPLANLVYENPDTLEIAARELGLKVQRSELFSRAGGSGISADPKVVGAAFSADVLERGYNSEPIEIGANHLVVLRVKEHKPVAPRALADVKQEIGEKLRTQAAQDRARALGETLQKRLSVGADPQALAKEHALQWVKTDFIGRTDSAVAEPAVVDVAFALGRPQGAAKTVPVVGGKRLASGDYAVIAVFGVKDGSPAALESSARLALQRQLQRGRADSEYQGFVDKLKSQTKIVVYQDKL